MKIQKTVTVKGVTWQVISANERNCTIEGRHFFARRCKPSTPWFLTEHDCDITKSEDGAREVGYVPYRFTDTGLLSMAASHVIARGEDLPSRNLHDDVPLIALTWLPDDDYLRRIGADPCNGDAR